MISSCYGLIQTPGICNGVRTENCMRQISYSQFFDFVETLNQDLKKLQPLYEEDSQQFDGKLKVERLNSLLETFDSSLDLFLNIFNVDTFTSSAKNESSFISPIFATMFTDYMQMTSDLFTHDFPNNSVLPFIGIYANLQKIYIDILCCAQNGINYEEGNISIMRFKSVWDRHYSIFSDLPNLIKSLDLPGFSQKLESVYQFTKNFNPEDNSQQQIFMMISNLSYLLKSMKEKLITVNEKTSKKQIQDLFNEATTFQEYVHTLGQTQLNGFHMSTLYSLINSLGIANSILNISEYLERMNQIIQQDNFAIDITDFATQDAQLITLKHIMKTMIFEFNCLIRFSHKAQPLSIKRSAQSLYQAIKSDNIELNEKYERLVELISPLTAQTDVEYEDIFISTMSNIRSPESIFESFKSTMKKTPKTIEDHCSRLSAFFEFEKASNLILNESNDIIKFKEYLFHNIISTKVQEIIPILEDQVSRAEGNLAQLSNAARMNQISSYCQTIILHLHQMIARNNIPKRARLFTKIFTLFMEFIDLIIKRGIPHNLFLQLIQNLAFPTPELIKNNLRGFNEISNLRLLISKIQMCQLNIAKTANVIYDKFAINKGNEDDYIQMDPTSGQFILDKEDIFSHQIGIFDRCDEYIRQLFLLLSNYKSFSNFFLIYSRFYELIGQNPSLFKISQKQSSDISPSLAKNIPIFIRSLIKLLRKEKNREPFLSVDSPLFDLYSTVLSFLKSTYLNENVDHSALFLHVLESIPIFNFSRSLSEFISDMNRIEIILLSSKSPENFNNSIKDYRDCTSSIIKGIIIDNNFNIDKMNSQIDRFLAGLFYLSPQIFAKVEEIFNSVVFFLKQLQSFKSFINSLYSIVSEFNLPLQMTNIKFEDEIFRNFILACSKVVKKISKAEFLSFEITDYLTGFTKTIKNSLPKRLFDKSDDFQFISIFQAFMNLFSSSVSFYQSPYFPLSISSLLPPPPPVSFPPNAFALPHMPSPISSSSTSTSILTSVQDSNPDQSILSLPSLPLPSLWFLNNFDFIQKVQPLLTSLTSIVATADENSENMKILIKMNEIVKKFDLLFAKSANSSAESESEEDSEFSKASHIDYNNLCLSKFSLAYKLKKMLQKINFEGQISQCQYIECFSSLESLIDTEINILHLNRLLFLTNFILHERIQNKINLIKCFKFTKCSDLNHTIKKDSKTTSKPIEVAMNTNSSKSSRNDEYDEYEDSDKSEETPEAADYEEDHEEADETEPTEQKRGIEKADKEKSKETESENLKESESKGKESNESKEEVEEDEGDYEEDHEEADNRKEEEDQEYGEDHDYGEYDYDDYSEIRGKSSISSNLRRSSIGNLGDNSIENVLYSNKGKSKNFFDYSFARKIDLDLRFIADTKSVKPKKDMISGSNSFSGIDRDLESHSDTSNESELNVSFNSFPLFDTNSNRNSEINFDRPARFQLQEVVENSDNMMTEIRKLIESSSIWMNGSPRDAMIPLIPLSEVASDVNSELHSTVDSIYQKFSTFDKSGGDMISAAKHLMEKSISKQNDLREKQKELFSKKRELARSKNVLSYTYALSIKKYEKLKSENMKKRYELQQLNTQLKLTEMMNNFDELEESAQPNFECKTNESSTSFLDGNENELIQSDSESENKNEPFHSSLSNSSRKPNQSSQSLVVEPFVPVRIVSSIGLAPVDAESASQALNEEILKNEKLKSLLRASNSTLKIKRKQNKLLSSQNQNKNNESIIKDDDENEKNDVVDRYFGQISLVRSFSEQLEKPISSEIDVDQAGEELIKAVSDFRKNSTESRQSYRENSKELFRKLDKMISIYKIQKDRTNKVRSLIRAAKVTKEDYKTALMRILDDE